MKLVTLNPARVVENSNYLLGRVELYSDAQRLAPTRKSPHVDCVVYKLTKPSSEVIVANDRPKESLYGSPIDWANLRFPMGGHGNASRSNDRRGSEVLSDCWHIGAFAPPVRPPGAK